MFLNPFLVQMHSVGDSQPLCSSSHCWTVVLVVNSRPCGPVCKLGFRESKCFNFYSFCISEKKSSLLVKLSKKWKTSRFHYPLLSYHKLPTWLSTFFRPLFGSSYAATKTGRTGLLSYCTTHSSPSSRAFLLACLLIHITEGHFAVYFTSRASLLQPWPVITSRLL